MPRIVRRGVERESARHLGNVTAEEIAGGWRGRGCRAATLELRLRLLPGGIPPLAGCPAHVLKLPPPGLCIERDRAGSNRGVSPAGGKCVVRRDALTAKVRSRQAHSFCHLMGVVDRIADEMAREPVAPLDGGCINVGWHARERAPDLGHESWSGMCLVLRGHRAAGERRVATAEAVAVSSREAQCASHGVGRCRRAADEAAPRPFR